MAFPQLKIISTWMPDAVEKSLCVGSLRSCPGPSCNENVRDIGTIVERMTYEFVRGYLGQLTQWKEFCFVTRRLWVHLPPMPLRSIPGQVACWSLSHACDSFTKELQLAWNELN